ncbi:bifunctional phosphoribosyl-AMP cyclohydrolase/phosphoribosyl-ATP diphosphatase HisIE [Gorillibacterium sp. sgz5001074]|uniref:bifunctional phosphoribosyl-AMP cyclohydrolase/phosphoribosyl-ATP diphosphatase HisIE n=1 Tax=Gorillibacterium sp. sgz5001074 TaxID=3446695 RepID=UPI003F669546
MSNETKQAATVEELAELIPWSPEGLVPAIVQDAVSKEVLMMAYMNRDALQRTVESGEAWFYSRSRQELWHKGGTSGHVQQVKSLAYDCDADTLLLKVLPQGPACHTNAYSCFYRELPLAGNDGSVTDGIDPADRFAILNTLEATIAKRDAERPEGAYTTYLFEKGVDKILKKVGEEAAEVIIAAKNRSAEELRYEASDLIYHLLVLLREQKLPLDEVLKELDRRHNK